MTFGGVRYTIWHRPEDDGIHTEPSQVYLYGIEDGVVLFKDKDAVGNEYYDMWPLDTIDGLSYGWTK